MKKLRVSHVIVQPVLIWDDGEELTPFEQQVNPFQIPLSQLTELSKKIKEEVKQIEEQFNTQHKE
ncbi:hypothetical protein CPT_Silence7 [Bacillus phage Silence]|nr:hypothetical protein CPT_Silence7 [Bacillus phage Silence]